MKQTDDCEHARDDKMTQWQATAAAAGADSRRYVRTTAQATTSDAPIQQLNWRFRC